MRDQRRELTALESKLAAREETFEKRLEAFERREADLNRRDQSLRTREKSLTDKEAEHQALIDEARTKLEAVAGLTREEAKRSLIDEMIGQARHDAARHIRDRRGRGARGGRPPRQAHRRRSRSSGWRANSSPSARSR